MKHLHGYRKLGRPTAHRWAMLRNLSTSLVVAERIETTLTRAKAMRPVIEKCVTRARHDSVVARRRVANVLTTAEAVKKMFADIAPRFKERAGGYTRIIKRGRRVGDSAQMAFIEFVDFDIND